MILVFNLEVTVCVFKSFFGNLCRFFVSDKHLIVVEFIDSSVNHQGNGENHNHSDQDDEIQRGREKQNACFFEVSNRHDVVDVASDYLDCFLSASVNDATAAFIGASFNF